MDHPLESLARRKPFVRRAMDRVRERVAPEPVAFIIVDRDMAEGSPFEYEPDMVMCAFASEAKEPIAIIRGQRESLEWIPELAPPGA